MANFSTLSHSSEDLVLSKYNNASDIIETAKTVLGVEGVNILERCVKIALATSFDKGENLLLLFPSVLLENTQFTSPEISKDIFTIVLLAKRYNTPLHVLNNAALLYAGVAFEFAKEGFSELKLQNHKISARTAALATAHIYIYGLPPACEDAISISVLMSSGIFKINVEGINYNEIENIPQRAEIAAMCAIAGIKPHLTAREAVDAINGFASRQDYFHTNLPNSQIVLRDVTGEVNATDCLHSLAHLKKFLNQTSDETLTLDDIFKAILKRENAINFKMSEKKLYYEVRKILTAGLRNVNYKLKNGTVLFDGIIDWQGKLNVKKHNFKNKDIQQLLKNTAAAIEANNDPNCLHPATTTSGSSGIIPAVVTYLIMKGYTLEKITEAFIIASSIPILLEVNASSSAAAGGCFLECGLTGAFAAALIVITSGGNFKQAVSASYLTYQNFIGAICSTLAGGVSHPCIYLNMQGAVLALTNANTVLDTGYACSFSAFDKLSVLAENITARMPKGVCETCVTGAAQCPSWKTKTLELETARGIKIPLPAEDVTTTPVKATAKEIKGFLITAKTIASGANRSLVDVCGGLTFGPSSSHSLAPARLSYLISLIVGSPFKVEEVWLYNSFASTGEMHGTTHAVPSGLAGIHPESNDFPSGKEIAEAKIGWADKLLKRTMQDSTKHQNYFETKLIDNENKSWFFSGISVGGGLGYLTKINSSEYQLSGRSPIVEIVQGEKYQELKSEDEYQFFLKQGSRIIDNIYY